MKGIADEDVAKGIKGQDPIAAGQLTREAIEAAEKDHKLRLKMAGAQAQDAGDQAEEAPRYTPVSKRQDKPDAVYWILRNHPEFADADIIKLIGTTKATIQKIRERSHWNATNIKAVDPVTLGLCSQLELDLAVTRANVKRERAIKRAAKAGATLKPVEDPAPAIVADSSDEPADEDQRTLINPLHHGRALTRPPSKRASASEKDSNSAREGAPARLAASRAAMVNWEEDSTSLYPNPPAPHVLDNFTLEGRSTHTASFSCGPRGSSSRPAGEDCCGIISNLSRVSADQRLAGCEGARRRTPSSQHGSSRCRGTATRFRNDPSRRRRASDRSREADKALTISSVADASTKASRGMRSLACATESP